MDKVTPSNIEAEQAVLGSMLIEPDFIPEIGGLLESGDFYCTGHQVVFKCLLAMDGNAVPIDPISLAEGLKKVRKLKAIGGTGYIATLLESTPAAANFAYYCRIIKDGSTRRKMITAGQKMMALGFDEQKSVEVLLGKADSIYSSLTDSQEQDDYWTSEQVFEKAKLEMPEVFTPVIGMSTGFLDLDLVTGGWSKEFIIIAGRPSMGKTAFLLNSLLKGWKKEPDREGVHLIYSLEQPREILALRCAAIFFDKYKSVLDFRRGRLEPEQRAEVFRIMDGLKKLPAYWFYEKDSSLEHFRRKVRQVARKEKIASVVIDHIGQMSVPHLSSQPTAEQSTISKACQLLVNEIDAPVIALHQLNRGVEGREDKRPRLSDLKQTGASEECADKVLGLYRDEYYNPNTDKPGVLEVNILKNRDGAIGSLDLIFNKKTLGMFNIHKQNHNEEEEVEYDFL